MWSIIPILVIALVSLVVFLSTNIRNKTSLENQGEPTEVVKNKPPLKNQVEVSKVVANMTATISGDEVEEVIKTPPSLPSRPPVELESEPVQKDLDRVLTFYPDDLITVYFSCRMLRDQKEKSPSDSIMAWLEDVVTLLEPYADQILRRDQKTALKNSDLHLYMISTFTLLAMSDQSESGTSSVEEVLEKLVAGTAQSRQWADIISTLAMLKEKALDASNLPSPIWKITELNETRTSYHSDYPITISAKEGTELLRVQGKVENISNDSDPDYAPWTKGRLPGNLFFKDTTGFPEKPRRFISENAVWLIDESGTWFPSYYSSQKCPALVGGMGLAMRFILTLGKKVATGFSTGSFVTKNNSFKLDTFFSVPKDSGPYKLIIIGAPPQAIPQ